MRKIRTKHSTAYGPFSFENSALNAIVQKRKDEGRDLKVLITSRNSQTGTGKTSLGLSLCKRWDDGFGIDQAILSPYEYVSLYRSLPPGSCVLWDEAELGADSRRSASNANLDISHAWASLRYREIFTFATLPSTAMLDNRLLELADLRINVVERGVAYPYKIVIDDFSGRVKMQRLTVPGTEDVKEVITWGSIDGLDVYEELKKKKREATLKKVGERFDEDSGTEDKSEEERKKREKKRLKESLREATPARYQDVEERNAKIRKIYNKYSGDGDDDDDDGITLTYADLGDIFGLAGSTVGNIVRGETG